MLLKNIKQISELSAIKKKKEIITKNNKYHYLYFIGYTVLEHKTDFFFFLTERSKSKNFSINNLL